jgi:parvulin-like peptidyl-prolyl isomerase
MEGDPVSRPAALVLVTASLSLVLAGCSSKSRPIITVGSQKVTVAEFERIARGAQAQYEGRPDSAKAMFIQDLERRALMMELAHQQGMEKSSAVVNTDRDNEQRALVQSLYGRIASPAQPVSEAEARALYEARNTEAQVWLIYTSSEQAAQAALARLHAGEPFAQVSHSYSLPGLLPPDGNMGWISPGALPDPLDGALRTQKLNEIGGPYHSREGWFLLEVAERRAKAQGPYELQRSTMMDLMRQRKQRAAFNRAYVDLKDEYDVQAAPGGAQLLFRIESASDPLTPTPDQRQMPLATYTGGVYTLNDALTDLQRADQQKPPFNLLPAIEIWIEAQVMTRVAVIEARRRHLNEEPDVAASLRAQREQAILNGIYQQAVAGVPAPGPDLVKMAWERVRHMYPKLVSAHVAVLEVADSSVARRIYEAHATVPLLADAAKQVDPALKVTETTVKYPNTDADWTSFTGLFVQLQPGAWYGPQQRPNGYRFLQLLDKQMGEQEFEELPRSVQQNIAGSAGELARDQRFNVFTDSLSRAYHPVVDHALIARLPWPVPTDAMR